MKAQIQGIDMPGTTTGTVRIQLRLEGLGVLIAAILAYARFGLGWGWFGAFFFLPDAAMLGYLAGPKIGAAIYNLAHFYLGAGLCLGAGVLLASPGLLSAGLIWCAHIGFDRALGYGLKYPAGFGSTHLGGVGRLAATAPASPTDPAAGREPL